MIGPMHAEPKIKQRVDWGYYSTPQEHILNRRLPVPRGKVVGRQQGAAPLAVPRVVGEVHRVDRPGLDAQALEREHRRAVADVAEGDRGLDREQLHGAILAPGPSGRPN
jgi:hypothetical protein